MILSNGETIQVKVLFMGDLSPMVGESFKAGARRGIGDFCHFHVASGIYIIFLILFGKVQQIRISGSYHATCTETGKNVCLVHAFI